MKVESKGVKVEVFEWDSHSWHKNIPCPFCKTFQLVVKEDINEDIDVTCINKECGKTFYVHTIPLDKQNWKKIDE